MSDSAGVAEVADKAELDRAVARDRADRAVARDRVVHLDKMAAPKDQKAEMDTDYYTALESSLSIHLNYIIIEYPSYIMAPALRRLWD